MRRNCPVYNERRGLLVFILGRKKDRIEPAQSRVGFTSQGQFETTNLYFEEEYNGSSSFNPLGAAEVPTEDCRHEAPRRQNP
jgi:hypothetical protein